MKRFSAQKHGREEEGKDLDISGRAPDLKPLMMAWLRELRKKRCKGGTKKRDLKAGQHLIPTAR